MKKYLFAISLTLLAVICQALILFVYEPVIGKEPNLLVQLFPAYFLIINLLMHNILVNTAKNAPKKFVNRFMGLTTGKMMISLIFVLIVGLASRPDFKAPSITFVVFYLLFMVLEVLFIVRDLKELKNN